jgi:hypothetical protein
LYRFDILVVPVWGLYANMSAQLLSQVTSHVIIAYHRALVNGARSQVRRERKDFEGQDSNADIEMNSQSARSSESSERGANAVNDATPDDHQPLYQHGFTRPHRGESEKLRVRPSVNPAIILVSVAAIVLTVCGCVLPCVSFNMQGLVGVAMESGNNFEEAKVYISIFSLARLLMDQARFLGTVKDFIGMLSVSILLVFSTLVVPVLLVLALLVEWFAPIKKRLQMQVRSLFEILQAWQYIEVLILSIIVGAWQIGDVSEFLLDDYCVDLTGQLSTLAFYGILKSEDARCFRVDAALEVACYILIAAGVLLIILAVFVSKAVYQRAREEDADEHLTPSHAASIVADGKNLDLKKIAPAPALFTDFFRWLLVPTR